jgi:FHS family L-fucose permease-like MFS transporter
LAILTSLFFIWGFITCLNDILIPHLKSVFTLNYTQAMLIQFAFHRLFCRVRSQRLSGRKSLQRQHHHWIKHSRQGCLLFYPAAGSHSYPLFLGAFLCWHPALFAQVAANPYVTILGKPKPPPAG